MPTTPEPPPPQPRRYSPLILPLVVLALWSLSTLLRHGAEPRVIRYDELTALVRAGQVKEVELQPNALVATLAPDANGHGERVQTTRLPGVDGAPLVAELEEHGVQLRGVAPQGSSWLGLVFAWLLPLGLMVLFYRWSGRRLGKAGGGGLFGFGQSRAKIYDNASAPSVTFADVAGVDEALGELAEVVDFLKQPERYRKLGAHIPKGVLLVGAPGTGKTLLARAVAGEAGVPFFSITGSEFVEMFVGVGAARVRDLFEQAKRRAPCLVFVDEIDAIGRARGGVGAMATHDEREQTLNQLLAEMDGFDPNAGVILMAATNRPEVLDPALLRAGRFDRQVLVDRPDVRGREAILHVHTRHLQLGSDIDLRLLAQRTPGMVGADLANVVNEAALAAARRQAPLVEQRDFDEAIDRIQLGLQKRGRVMSPDEKRRVATHEAGHALVALSLPHADPVSRVTIIPRASSHGGALGATLQLPTDDRYLLTRAELRDRICVLLGGRAAEELAFEDVSTGAQDDLERATAIAHQMVCRFGMSDELGARTYGVAVESPYLAGRELEERNYSDEAARRIDSAVRALIEQQHERARDLLNERRAALDAVCARLLAVETIERAELESLGRPASPAAA